MNEHRSAPSPSSGAPRRHRRRKSTRRRRGGKPPLLWAGLAAGTALLFVGGLALQERSAASDDAAGASSAGREEHSPGSSPASERQVSREAVEDGRKKGDEKEEGEEKGDGTERDEKEKGPDPASIPASGPGTFATAGGDGDRVGGSGRTLTYVVQVEDGIGISPRDVATEVERVLADERGWTADGKVGFRRVSGGASDFRVRLATAATVDDICGQYGLDTGGEVNCNVGQDVMVNLKRWLLATEYYADDVTSYRALIINHEVGHFLGHGHVGCPGPGRPAPVMMQQIKGLHGCRTNVWPYDADGRLVSGPAVG
ncbi:DUF3152 domain-containing protein [Streptomyces sp. AC627_RSS907]|uniref:DUF3152 domain-containing protein n=1 Tax=Streptomyces sp. AC627_RSS907 TaxID=2823684 RepID=UPI001C225691|nr:DUF3152 domain-containing protein [Streptomyces sp. AC627_RSS907]